jgi:predicted O-linked N-acetylglucosamine transferase (SPINDLY family)
MDPVGHLALYDRIDIALDTFPYNGTTTTCEALWMGVPVVTLVGRTHASRVGVSLLSSVGLTELAADSSQHYIEAAVAFARDRKRLSELHRNLRRRMQDSPLVDHRGHTRRLEMALRAMWRAWCASLR